MGVGVNWVLQQEGCHSINAHVDEDGSVWLTQVAAAHTGFVLLGREQMKQLRELIDDDLCNSKRN